MQVGIWIRVSTQDQAMSGSPTTHKERAEYFAKAKEWDVVAVYDLSGVSGKSVLEHPEAVRMLTDLETGKIQALVFSKLARLARNTKELLRIAEIFEAKGAHLVSIEESIDTGTSAGRLLYTVMAALAEFEREQISERVSASVESRARQGKPTGGRPPMGYMWDSEQRLVTNPKEVPIVLRAFEIFAETERLKTTCERLTSEGFRARKSEFSPTTLKRLLTNTIYIGKKLANYSTNKGNTRSWKYKNKDEWVYIDVDPLIKVEKWEQVNSIIKQNAKHSQQGIPKKGKYLFSGLLVCDCGEKLYVSPYNGMKTPKYLCRNCRRKINEDVLETHLNEALKVMLTSPNEVKPVNDYESERRVKEERVKLLMKDIKSIDKDIDSLISLFGNKRIDDATFSKRFEPLQKRQSQINAEIPRLEAEISLVKSNSINKDFLIEQAISYASLWPILTYIEKQKLIQELISNIKVEAEKLHFTFSYNPNERSLGNSKQTIRDSLPQPA
jgi:site-specific DNA recombinase